MRAIYKPAGLDLEGLLTRDDYEKYGQGIYGLCHLIIRQKVNNPEEKTPGGYVNIHSDKLKNLFTHHKYGRTLQLAIQHGIIEQNGSYSAGRNSKSYRLGRNYYRQDWVRHDTPKKLAVKLRKEFAFDPSSLSPLHRHLYENVKKLKLNVPLHIYSALKVEQQARVDSFVDGDVYLKTCKNGRVYTPVTTLSKVVRPYFTYGGETLVGLDIANSQPLFLMVLLRNLYPYNPMYTQHQPTHQGHQPNIHPYVLHNGILPVDIQECLAMTQKGEFYDLFAEKLGMTREQAKDKILKCLMTDWTGRPCPQCGKITHRKCTSCHCGHVFTTKGTRVRPYGISTRLPSLIKSCMPNVYNFISDFKKDDYRALANKLQQLESGFMIDTVCHRLMVEHPNMPVISIHDCLLTTEEHYDTLKRIAREEFARIDLNPTFHKEQLCTNMN